MINVNPLQNITIDGIQYDIVNAISVEYGDVFDLKQSGQLIFGALYRITDYICTVNNDYSNAQAKNEGLFDILIVADSESTFNENVRFIHHEGDTYFSGCNLGAWEGKYCIDNDTTRFDWADDTPTGKGVIYWLKDEWGNECPYDFKNIQFKRIAITNVQATGITSKLLSELKTTFVYGNNGGVCYGQVDQWGDYTPINISSDITINYIFNDLIVRWYYTFTWVDKDNVVKDASIFGQQLTNYEGHYSGVFNNQIQPVSQYKFYPDSPNKFGYSLNNIVFISSHSYDGFGTFYGCYGNKFGVNCYNNTFGNDCNSNTLGSECYDNTFGNGCYYNIFGNNCYSNTFGNRCDNNIFGNYCDSNTFGNYCYENKFGNSCFYTTFGNDCWDNTFGNSCGYNTLGNNCEGNTFGNFCDWNYCNIDYICFCNFENNVGYCVISSGYTTSNSNRLQNIIVLNGTKGVIGGLLDLSGLTVGVDYHQACGLNSDRVYTVKNLLDDESIEFKGENYIYVSGDTIGTTLHGGNGITIDSDGSINVPTEQHKLLYSYYDKTLTPDFLMEEDIYVVDSVNHPEDLTKCMGVKPNTININEEWQQYSDSNFSPEYFKGYTNYRDNHKSSKSDFGYGYWNSTTDYLIKNPNNTQDFCGFINPIKSNKFSYTSIIGSNIGKITGGSGGFSLINDSHAIPRHIICDDGNTYYRNTLYDLTDSNGKSNSDLADSAWCAWVCENSDGSAYIIYSNVSTQQIDGYYYDLFPEGTVDVYYVTYTKTKNDRVNHGEVYKTVIVSEKNEASGYLVLLNVCTSTQILSPLFYQNQSKYQGYSGTTAIYTVVLSCGPKKTLNNTYPGLSGASHNFGNVNINGTTYWPMETQCHFVVPRGDIGGYEYMNGQNLVEYKSNLDLYNDNGYSFIRSNMSFDNGKLEIKFSDAEGVRYGSMPSDYLNNDKIEENLPLNGNSITIDFNSGEYVMNGYSGYTETKKINTIPNINDFNYFVGFDNSNNPIYEKINVADFFKSGEKLKFMYFASSFSNTCYKCVGFGLEDRLILDVGNNDVLIYNFISGDYEPEIGSVPTKYFTGSHISYNEITEKLWYSNGTEITQIATNCGCGEGNGEGGSLFCAGSGITFNDDNEDCVTINSNTEGTTVEDIRCTEGAPVDGRGLWDGGDIIPSGTTLQEILVKLFCRELFPKAATKPNIDLKLGSNGSLSTQEIGASVEIPSVTISKIDGKFNSGNYTKTQPSPKDVTFSGYTITSELNNGFSGYTEIDETNDSSGFTVPATKATVLLGSNKITFDGKLYYTKPSNMPLTNLDNKTQSTKEISTDGTDISAIWDDSGATKTLTVTAEGVYPVFINTNSEMTSHIPSNVVDGIETANFAKLPLTNSKEIEFNDPGEEKYHLIIDFPKYYNDNGIPTERTLNIQIYNKMSDGYVSYTGSYNVEQEFIHYINGEYYEYKRLEFTGAFVGKDKYKLVFNASLNK